MSLQTEPMFRNTQTMYRFIMAASNRAFADPLFIQYPVKVAEVGKKCPLFVGAEFCFSLFYFEQ